MRQGRATVSEAHQQVLSTVTESGVTVETQWVPCLVDQDTHPYLYGLRVRVTQDGADQTEPTVLWVLLGYPADVPSAHEAHQSLVADIERHGWPRDEQERKSKLARWFLSR